MHLPKILTPLATAAVLAAATPLALAQSALPVSAPLEARSAAGASGDEVLREMQQAFRRGDRGRLALLLPSARNHPLEPWAAYWELRARLEEAQPEEVQVFLQRWAGTYQEDRLRNDWLRQLGQRRDWARFAELHPSFRMGDDREVSCYATTIDHLRGTLPATGVQDMLGHWQAQRDADDGCTHAAGELFSARQLPALEVWRKARLSAEANRQRATRDAVAIAAPDVSNLVADLYANPAKFLGSRVAAPTRQRQELVVLALIRLAAKDPDNAAALLEGKWGVQLTAEERHWTWGVIGKQAALRLSPSAMEHFNKVAKDSDLSDDLLTWKVRAALRAGDWKAVHRSINAMSPNMREDSTWTYWKARSLLADRPGDEDRAQARVLLGNIAGTSGFYEQLALEDLGQRITVPPAPAPLTAQEKAAARANPSLARGLYAISMGLRSEGVREWNYATNLHTPGGMGERELLAAADLACEREVWDRCINTSERTKSVADYRQRFPMPFQKAVVAHSQGVGLDPAYVYGLIR
ncbi:MAG: lytic transglycosylase domain-containing protein, partial [Giesbergeria sp.]|nr:lytic transglycosylase domain-containing protein [Giesbergeria sp.]